MNIEEGKFYRTRDGRKVGPMSIKSPRLVWVNGIEGDWYKKDGRRSSFTEQEDDLIKEWQDGPVRTVTRKEIVPGSYGCVVVCNDGSVSAACDTAAELRAAAATLIEIADALEDV
jgi:hypothetical protein